MKHRLLLLSVVGLLAPISSNAQTAQTTTQGSANCGVLTQAAATAMDGRIKANNNYEKQPESVGSLSCLNGIFNASGLNLISSMLSPQDMIGSVLSDMESQICNAAQSAWSNTVGSAQQCGLSLNGVNLGLGLDTGGGLMCPSLTFGGSGPRLGSVGVGSGASNFYNNGVPQLPTGYSDANPSGGIF